MKKETSHPGEVLLSILKDKGLTQRELALKLSLPHSVINSIIKGSRKINASTALALESASIETAIYWLQLQAINSIEEAKSDNKIQEKNNRIKVWDKINGDLVPLNFIKKHVPSIKSPDDLDRVYSLYGASNEKSLQKVIKKFDFPLFRKSDKFHEIKNNTIAWSVVAKYKADQLKVGKFKPTKQKELLAELKKCISKNENLLENVAKILSKYGIKFDVLDRPTKMPVEGVSFMSGKNPAIIMTLKYKRLDNFAFGLYHELGHVFCHLTDKKYEQHDFLNYNSKDEKFEREADNFASDNLIDPDLWTDFLIECDDFNDDEIENFSKTNGIHPCIVRGRVCFTYNEHYRKRSKFTSENYLG